MLFDLRGRGRRRTVQAIYLSLAVLMGGGLVLFGIGSSTSGGGIVDAVIGDGSGGDSASGTLDKRVETAVEKTKASPRNAAAWGELARLRYQRASLDGLNAAETGYTTDGKKRLRLASEAWDRHLELDPKQPNARVARLMVQAYDATALNEPVKAVRAMEIVTAAEKPPNSNLFAQLARLAYIAGETRTGDLAADRSIDLADNDQKKLLREQLKQLKASGAAQAAQATTTTSG